jgi:hypothetical protein
MTSVLGGGAVHRRQPFFFLYFSLSPLENRATMQHFRVVPCCFEILITVFIFLIFTFESFIKF